MEKIQSIPQKFSSFSNSIREAAREIDRSFSLSNVKLQKSYAKEDRNVGDNITIEEVEEEEEEEEEEDDSTIEAAQASLASFSEEIDVFLATIHSWEGGQDEQAEPPAILETVVEKFLDLAEEIGWSTEGEGDYNFFDTIDRLAKLTSATTPFASNLKYRQAMNRADSILHRTMCFLEDELHSLLQDPKSRKQAQTRWPASFGRIQDLAERSAVPEPTTDSPQTLPLETIARLRRITGAMISCGYTTECCQVFAIARRHAFEAGLSRLGYERLNIDDVVRMAWEPLESEIALWIRVFHHFVEVALARERDLCNGVFAGHDDAAYDVFYDLVHSATISLLTFTEAIAMTKRTTEKLFRVLDMYEALRDATPKINDLLRPHESSAFDDLKTEISAVQSRLGEAATAIFCGLESSIKNDVTRTAMPGGAVHPLTRYVMNYLKYACEYKNTMEQVFRESREGEDQGNLFAAKLLEIMDLLHANLDAKSRLYRDLALRSIFMMNNGRYIVQKIKGSVEIRQVLGETWSRKRSTELRQYHKNYQRETWSRVLVCLRDVGLVVQGKGGVAKPVLKERLKSFNLQFEEIHKAQCLWVVSDEQLQSELRVSVSAVIVPAYRSFLGRFAQYLDPGRQTEKYIKFGVEELENYIEELFSGQPSSIVGRRRP